MTVTVLPWAPLDVLSVTAGPWYARTVIELGERLRGMPAAYCRTDHVIVVTHQAADGRVMGIQGQPGGVGIVDCGPYLASPLTTTNHGQPRLNDRGQVAAGLAACARLVGVRYDWTGIGMDDMAALHIPAELLELVDRSWQARVAHGLLPGEVVCSSMAAAVYALPEVAWAHPDIGTERLCEPSDWRRWNETRAWEHPAGM